MGYNAVAAQVRGARRGKALSQAALAERSGVSRVTIARVEGGSLQDFRVGTLARLCDALGLELGSVPHESGSALPALLAREQVAAALLDPGEWADALFQSSPWSFALEPPAA